MLRIILSAFSDIIDLASLLAINISEVKLMDDFNELSEATLAKIRAFGIKSQTVIKGFKRYCRLLKAFLLENGLEFSPESAVYGLSGFKSLKEGTRSQRILSVFENE